MYSLQWAWAPPQSVAKALLTILETGDEMLFYGGGAGRMLHFQA